MSETAEAPVEINVESIVFKQELAIPCYLVDPQTGQLIDDRHLVVWNAPELNDAIITQINKTGNAVTAYETPHQVLREVLDAKEYLRSSNKPIQNIGVTQLVDIYEQAERDQTVPEGFEPLIGNFVKVMPLITQEHRRRIAYDALTKGAAILGHAEEKTLPTSY